MSTSRLTCAATPPGTTSRPTNRYGICLPSHGDLRLSAAVGQSSAVAGQGSRSPGCVAPTHRHAGHADIVRELIDGATGMQQDNDNMVPGDQAWWANYRNRLEHVAQEASRR
nr:DUF664 domain-containing protein [Kibdelosporangium sp. MJ126-NF4]